MCVCVLWSTASLRPTVSVHVVVAGVPFAVAVGVPLVGVLHMAAVVAGVSVGVLVTVPLIHVGLQPAVVLGKRDRETEPDV